MHSASLILKQSLLEALNLEICFRTLSDIYQAQLHFNDALQVYVIKPNF